MTLKIEMRQAVIQKLISFYKETMEATISGKISVETAELMSRLGDQLKEILDILYEETTYENE